MERDKLIAVVLVVGLIFLFVALIGVITITGFVLFFVTNDAQAVDNTPIIETAGSNSNNGTQTIAPPVTQPSTTPSSNPPPQEQEEEPEPVCGNGVKEDGCACEEKPPEKTVLEDIEFDSFVYSFACVEKDGQSGLGARQVILKNTGSSDFEYEGTIKVTAENDEFTDTLTISKQNLGDFRIAADGEARIYLTSTSRADKFLFLSNQLTDVEITVEFEDNKVVRYTKTLKGQDFSEGNCR